MLSLMFEDKWENEGIKSYSECGSIKVDCMATHDVLGL